MSALSFAKIGVLSGILALASTACTTPVDDADFENVGEVSQEAQATQVVLANVEVVSNPLDEVGGIVPCVKVWRYLYQSSLVNDNRGLEFDITYTSRGRTVEETVLVPMADSDLMGQDPNNNKLVLLDNMIDLEQPLDDDNVQVDVRLIKNLNNY